MIIVKWKGVWKSYTLYDSDHVTIWKGKTGDGKEISRVYKGSVRETMMYDTVLVAGTHLSKAAELYKERDLNVNYEFQLITVY